MTRSLSPLALTLIAACGSESGPTTYVLLDRDAREAGYALELSGSTFRGAPLLPISISERDEVFLHDGVKRTKLPVLAGELAYVRGAAGRITYRALGTEVPIDRLRIEATISAATELAQTIDAELERESSDRFLLFTRDDIYALTAFLDAPPGLIGAEPAIAAALEPVIFESDDTAVPTSRELPELVGVHAGNGRVLIIDAGGKFQLSECVREPVRGRVHHEGGALRFEVEDAESFLLALDDDAIEGFDILRGDR